VLFHRAHGHTVPTESLLEEPIRLCFAAGSVAAAMVLKARSFLGFRRSCTRGVCPQGGGLCEIVSHGWARDGPRQACLLRWCGGFAADGVRRGVRSRIIRGSALSSGG